MKLNRPLGLCFVAGLLALAGCKGIQTSEERAARRQAEAVAANYRPRNEKPALPVLAPDAPFSNFVSYALLNSPAVEAAYYDWLGSIERITVERSLPDPRLTFESDIANVVMTVMPGFMQEFPGPGKLRSRAAVAGAESQSKYFAFETAALRAVFDLKKSVYDLRLLDEKLRINRETLSLLDNLEKIARAQNEVGKATLQDVLRAQIEQDRVRTEIASLEDTRKPMLAAFKAALGLKREQPDPPFPKQIQIAETNLSGEELLDIAFARNPRLKAMEADVRAAEAGIAMAYKERVPDFSLGLMADVKAAPVMFRPLAGITLPIWRDKIAAEVAQAKAGELAARARLNAEQITLTVGFAEKSFSLREISRNLTLLDTQLIPKARQSLELARAGYLSGTIDFFNLMDAERTLLGFQLADAEARAQRDTVLAELSLTIAGVLPAETPWSLNNATTEISK